ncbi:MAG: D-Ala-D-Ala carboxypeptidase family metallohydrolase [Anaerolineales bacterium]|nr:D-Ala-D-Ala carboxypeptidase family metallohydrolase [Anaerolineales bacterium]
MTTRVSNVDDEWDVRHFKPEEFACTHCGKNETVMELIYRLDDLRSRYGHPLTINSGYRCSYHPLSVDKRGNVTKSSHVKGLAADIAISGSRQRFMILALIHEYDLFQRVGIAKNFIHVDIDQDKTEFVTWLY